MPLHLLVDIGGTHCRFAWVSTGQQVPEAWQCQTNDFTTCEDAIAHALSLANQMPDAMAIAAAGPVSGGICQLTNATWLIDSMALATRLAIPRVTVVNDLAAVAQAVPLLPDTAVRHLGGPQELPFTPPALVLGIGTGLGSAILAPGNQVISSEGGQIDWASNDPTEAAALRSFCPSGQHLPAESILAASALSRLYAAFAPAAPALSAQEIPPRSSIDPIAAQVMQLYAQMLGRYAGNAVLMTGARGGLYLAGEALSTWGGAFDAALFYRRFLAKGRFQAYLEQVPVKLITTPTPAFTGLLSLIEHANSQAAAPNRLA